MRDFRLAVCFAIALLSAISNTMAATNEGDPRAYLEGIWLIGTVPDKGDCLRDWYDGATQIEFEFRKSGGRALIFEPGDLFTAIQIAKTENSGDGVTITARGRDGSLTPIWLIRSMQADRMELNGVDKEGKIHKSGAAYRCGAPNHDVNGDMPMDALRPLTPEITGAVGFPAAIDGVSDEDICTGRGYVERLRSGVSEAWIQFELLGPVHYWVIGQYLKRAGRSVEFDYVRAVQQAGPNTLKLRMQEHVGSRGGWDWSPTGAFYELTVVIKERHIDIPELAMSFIRCEPPSRGMHRWGARRATDVRAQMQRGGAGL